jgi:hypothetical protein
LKADTRANSKACNEISCATEQGIISAEQGIPAQEQGILSDQNHSHRRMRFSVRTRIANIEPNDAMILPYEANPNPMTFSERTRLLKL